jgi:methionyl-tRNA formyltransferase
MPTRIVFMGMNCAFSLIPFRALLDAGQNVVGLIIPSPGRAAVNARWLAANPQSLPMLPGTLFDLALARGLPALEVGSLRAAESLAALDALHPDLICAACFPRLLPPAWLNRPRLGCLNLHPSLLPAYRGPEPLFWQFRNGEARTGVTLHFMDEGADTGDIVAQAGVPFADGISGAEAERLAAQAGAQILLDALARPTLPRRPQPAVGASRAPRPARADLVITTDWSARRVFNFIRGAGDWGPFEIKIEGRRLSVSSAHSYTPGGVLGAAYRPENGDLRVQFSPGIVRLRTSD